jgi:hypothetical protein
VAIVVAMVFPAHNQGRTAQTVKQKGQRIPGAVVLYFEK